MNGAEQLTASLTEHSIDTVFGYPGGCIMPFYDALLESPLKHVLCRHEQACALAADGYARASGQIGVCVATSGPGATNLITGVANAFADSIPMLVITGQVPAGLIGTDAFQETDILGMTFGIVKHSYLVTSADDIAETVAEAIRLATEGRPGPVWIDIPKDVLLAEVDQHATHCPSIEMETDAELDNALVQEALNLLKSAERPMLYSGGGVVIADAVEAFRQFCQTTGLPSAVTLKGIGNNAHDYPLDLGMLGMHGSRAANETVQKCDLLVAVGARFDDRATGAIQTFAPNARIIHIDYDAAEMGKLKQVDVRLRGDLKQLLPALSTALDIEPWRQQCLNRLQSGGFQVSANSDAEAISGPSFINQLARIAPTDTIVSCDVGQHQMWVAQYGRFRHPRQHLSSGGLGTMGFGLPAAIGAQLACPEQFVVNVSGDGSFMMNLQELATIKRYNLPIKIIILDNQHLGMVRQQQELFYAKRFSEVDLSDNPDFAKVAQAFDIPTQTIHHTGQIRRSIETLFAYQGPMLLHVHIAQQENVWPMVAPGGSNSQMLHASAG